MSLECSKMWHHSRSVIDKSRGVIYSHSVINYSKIIFIVQATAVTISRLTNLSLYIQLTPLLKIFFVALKLDLDVRQTHLKFCRLMRFGEKVIQLES